MPSRGQNLYHNSWCFRKGSNNRIVIPKGIPNRVPLSSKQTRQVSEAFQLCKYRRSEVLNTAQQRERLPKFPITATQILARALMNTLLACTWQLRCPIYIQSKIASEIVSLHVLDVFNPICQIFSCVTPVSLIIWFEFSLMRPYILILSHEPPDFVCNTFFNT